MRHAFEQAEPSAIMWGMTDEMFWSGRPWLFAVYREAHVRRSRERDWERWQLGAYVYDALSRTSGLLNPFAEPHESLPWPETPYGMEPPEEGIPDDDEERSVAEQIMSLVRRRT